MIWATKPLAILSMKFCLSLELFWQKRHRFQTSYGFAGGAGLKSIEMTKGFLNDLSLEHEAKFILKRIQNRALGIIGNLKSRLILISDTVA